MEHFYLDADRIAFTCCFLLAALTAAAYGRWHFWWWTGFGRARMAVIVSFAGLTLERTVYVWARFRTYSTPGDIMHGLRTASAAAASIALAYMLYGIVSVNLRQVREPGFAAGRGRRHLERTPSATQAEVEKLIACWDEMHDNEGKLPAPGHSAASVQPDQEMP